MNRVTAWIRASRLPAQSYLFFPLLAGQLLGIGDSGSFHLGILGWGHLYGVFMTLYIVYANDVADVETDAINDDYTVFSGGSRVLVDGDISPRSLAVAAVSMAILCLGVGGVLAWRYDRPVAVLLIAAGLLLLWMYSYPPVRLSYRGGGELLQMLGVGGIVPLLGYYAQSGVVSTFPVKVWGVWFPTQLACAIATGLPDLSSDRRSGKKTVSVWLGSRGARGGILVLNAWSVAGIVILDVIPSGDWIGWIGTGILGVAVLLIGACQKKEPSRSKVWTVVFLSILIALGSSFLVGYGAVNEAGG